MDWLTVLFHGIPLPDLFGHLFYIIILTGTTLVGNKKKIGWLFRIVGDIGWVIIGVYIGMTSIMVWSSIFALNEVRNFLIWKWSEDENSKLQSQRKGTTEVCSSEDPGSIQSSRGRRSIQTDGKPWAGFDAECDCIICTANKLGVQKYEELPKPKRIRTSKGKRKTRPNPGSVLEAAEKRARSDNSISKPGRLPKTNKRKK